jgi:hypothetical protein
MTIVITCEFFGRTRVQKYTTQGDALKWITALLANDVPFTVDYQKIN